jgi:hypothetical protein
LKETAFQVWQVVASPPEFENLMSLDRPGIMEASMPRIFMASKNRLANPMAFEARDDNVAAEVNKLSVE